MANVMDLISGLNNKEDKLMNNLGAAFKLNGLSIEEVLAKRDAESKAKLEVIRIAREEKAALTAIKVIEAKTAALKKSAFSRKLAAKAVRDTQLAGTQERINSFLGKNKPVSEEEIREFEKKIVGSKAWSDEMRTRTEKKVEILDVNKKRLSVKNQTNIMNISYNGYSEDPDIEVEASTITYVGFMESELLRGYRKFPLITESRYIGCRGIETTRVIKDIQDEVMFLTIHANDSITPNMFRVLVTEDEVYVHLEGSKIVALMSSKECNMSILTNSNFKVYEGLLYSPAQEKKQTLTCFKVYEGNLLNYTEDAVLEGEKSTLATLDQISSGMLNILINKGKLDFKNAVKMNARLSQILAPSEVLGLSDAYGIIFDKKRMDFVDGGGVSRAESLSKWMTNGLFNGYKVNADLIAGKITQVRPLGVKAAFIATDDAFINYEMSKFVVIRLERNEISKSVQEQIELAFEEKGMFAPIDLKMTSTGEIKKLEDNTLVPYIVDDSILGDVVDSFAGHGRFTVKRGVLRLSTMLVIGDKTIVPDFVTDTNAFKAPVDFRVQAKFVVLDEAKGFDGNGRLSMQMASTLLLSGQPGLEYLRKAMVGNVNESYAKLMDPTVGIPTIEAFNKFFLVGMMESAAKTFVLNHDAPAFKTMANHWLKGQNTNIGKFNILVKNSGFARLTTDWSLLLAGLHILDKDECFSLDILKEYENMENALAKKVINLQPETDKNKITKKTLNKATDIEAIEKITSDEDTIAMAKVYFEFKNAPKLSINFRSPKMGLGEFARLEALTLKTVYARIDERIKDVVLNTVLKNFFKSIKPGTFIIPAMEIYKELLGGADFDFDGITVVCDQNFIKAMNGIESVIVSVKKNKVESSEDDYRVGSFTDVSEIARRQFFNGNMTIGQITNMNQLIELLLFEDEDLVKKLLRKNFVREDHVIAKKYISPFILIDGVYEIDNDSLEIAVKRMCNSTLSSNEISDIIHDLNKILRAYQERTIDASKSAEIIEVLFNLLKDVSLLCLYDTAEVNVDWKESKVIAKYDKRSSFYSKLKKGKRKGQLYFVINDVFHKIMVEAYERLEEIGTELVAHVASMKLTGEHLMTLSAAHSKYDKFDETIIDISNRYKEANGIRISKVIALQDKSGKIGKFLRNVVVPDISAEYNEVINGLRMMTRELLKDVPSIERAAIVKYIAIHSKNEDGVVTLNPTGGSSICHTLLPEEYMLFVMSIDEETSKIAKSKVYGAGKIESGDTAEVINGVSTAVRPFIGNKDINGTFSVVKDETGSYLVEDIENLINVEMPTKRTVVVRLFPKVKGAYKSLIKALDQDGLKAIKLTPFNGKNSKYDKVEMIVDGVIKPLCKFQAPTGNSPLGNMLKGFVGNVTSVCYNKYVSEDDMGNKSSWYSILVVAEEADVEYKRVSPFDLMNKKAEMATIGGINTGLSASDLFSGFKSVKAPVAASIVAPAVVVTPEVKVTSFEELTGAYVDDDMSNFLNSLK